MPDSEFCNWNGFLKKRVKANSVFEKKDYKPSPEKPLVYHLHGHINDPFSMVLTETDYLDFLINLSAEEEMLPYQIHTALNGISLLFVGYGLRDLNFGFL